MTFEWDEQKRAANLEKHGIDFEAAKLIFDGLTVTIPDTRRDYGEPRIGVYGEVEGVLLFVIYTQRGNNRRIISARKAGTYEREAYNACLAAQGTIQKDKTDWTRVRAMTDAEIEDAVASDPDTFIPDAKWFDKAKIVMPKPKEMVTLRLDPDIVEWFRHGGRGYQTRINAVLKAFVESHGQRPSQSS